MSAGPATPAAAEPRRRVLSPDERASEVLFGLIMVMTFTGSISAASADHGDMHEMLVAVLGCNTAWGVVDAVMYLMTTLATRGSGLAALRRLRAAATPGEAHRIIADALPQPVARVMREDELAGLRARLVSLEDVPARPELTGRDLLGALAVFLLVVLATLPVAIPFVVMRDVHSAVRVSHAIAIVIMFGVGVRLGHWAGIAAVPTGLVTASLGVALAALTMVLGG